MSFESVMSFNHYICCRFLLLLPSIFPSIRVFYNQSALPIRSPKYWNFSISTSNEYSELISFRIDCFDLLAIQGTLFESINSQTISFLYGSTLTSIHDYQKKTALTIQTFVDKVISLFFNTLSRLVITFLLRIKLLLISWLQSPSAVILEPKNKVCHCCHCFPIYLP